MVSSIKRSAIPASGYMYQMLVGIRLLCEWLDNPTLYAWVKFEADDEQDARGLDDIVAQRPDGQVELTQVKFTVDPFDPDNALSWAWLTGRKGRGKSLLEKWSGAALRVGTQRLCDARLITNRRPDAEFTSCLLQGKLQWDSVPAVLREEIAPHLGGEEGAAQFFEQFEFSHSYAGCQSLMRTVSSSLETRHTDHVGWLMLYRRAIEWSIHKNAPAPDGRITLEVLRSTISERQPRPLDQEFRIPAGYLPTDQQFAREFVDKVAAGAWTARVLWGSPGQGKSTFLSFACKQLQERGVVVIRHHYFLDLQDPSDRFSLKSVARSLMAQLESEFGESIGHLSDRPEGIRDWLATCGQARAADGSRLVVVVDGLDHVWRENDEEISPLNELFAQLLPVPKGVTLVLGTQRVGHEQLPRRIHRFLEPEDWVELPRMHLSSVFTWLRAQHDNGIFQLLPDQPAEQALGALAQAFYTVSEGHPLVLTYSLLQLAHQHPVLSSAVVQHHALAPHGDARAYYKALWQRLSWVARDALHLIAEHRFIWPAGALEQCLGLADVNLEAEIGHLLAPVDAGLIAFHGSLYVFIGQQPEHYERVRALLPRVEGWLAADAPDYLRWAWLWLFESRLGEHSNLLAATTREWVLDALVRAFEAPQIVRILEAAEEVAFASGDYEQAIQKRALKNRVDNGLKYQLEDTDTLRDCALRLAPDPYPALLLASRGSHSSLAALQQVACLYLSLDQVGRAGEVQECMRGRINDRIGAGTMEAREYEEAIESYLDVAAGTGQYDPARVLRLLRKHSKAEEVFESFLAVSSAGSDLSPIMAFACLPMSARLRRVLETQAVRVAGWARARLHEHQEFRRFDKHPLSVCWALLYDKQPTVGMRTPQLAEPPSLHNEMGSDDDADFARYLHHTFFATVANILLLRGALDPIGLGIKTSRPWLSTMLGRLSIAAQAVAGVLARGETPATSLVYRLTSGERPAGYDHGSWADLRAMRKALALITADLFLVTRLRSALPHVPAAEWVACARSEFFAPEHWRNIFLMRKYQLLHPETVRSHIQEQAHTVSSTVGPFNEKAGTLADLCRWAVAYDLPELAHELLAGAYRYSIGFGWRKDPGLARLLQAIEDFAEYDPSVAKSAIEKLAPVYDRIDEMTEDSGVRPSDLAVLLLKLMPSVYVRYYANWLARGEWYYADRTFAAFVENADLAVPEIGVALAFVSGGETVQALRERLREPANAALTLVNRLWDCPYPEGSDEDRGSYVSEIAGLAGEAEETGQSPMPLVEEFPPSRLAEFLAAVAAAGLYALHSKTIRDWFSHWESEGLGMELLAAIEAMVKLGVTPLRGTELLDPAFHLSWRLQGPERAFPWLVWAHQHRYGWSEDYYGKSDSQQRLALVAERYPRRWAEFLALSTRPPPRYPERSRAIPDAGLMRLLLEVGELVRARSVLESMVDVVVQEFDCQPLVCPAWWQEPRA